MDRIPVAILGATGTVGQKAVALLSRHPKFFVSEVSASSAKAGKKYGDVICWREQLPLPSEVENLVMKEPLDVVSPYIISALPASIAKSIELTLAQRGHIIISNASAHRMEENVPLLIPEVNASHFSLIDQQKTKGKIITNPNCVAIPVALALAPLMELGTIKHVSIVTLQAISGAGFPGVSSLDILGNLIPFIEGEEEKIDCEVRKILDSNFPLAIHVHRVPVLHGHTVALHVHFTENIDPMQAKEAYLAKNRIYPGLYELHEETHFPQPARNLTPDDQRIHIGRLKQGGVENVIGMIVLEHNLVRGAAGAAIANLELFLAREEQQCLL